MLAVCVCVCVFQGWALLCPEDRGNYSDSLNVRDTANVCKCHDLPGKSKTKIQKKIAQTAENKWK